LLTANDNHIYLKACIPVEATLNVGVDPLVLVAGRAKVYHLKPEMTELLFFSGLWGISVTVAMCSCAARWQHKTQGVPGKQTRTLDTLELKQNCIFMFMRKC
jgi:hypothetical protein